MLHAVVMAGGSGTRFWPKSRRNRPKQLLKLHGDATMLQQTVRRIAPLVPPERILIITGGDQAAAVREQLPELPAENVVSEPCPRDTGPCVGLAAAIVAERDPDGTMIVMPADHVISPAETFLKTVRAALGVIDEDPSAFVTFGVRPTRPETGYGYIERGESLGNPEDALNRVVQFREAESRDGRGVPEGGQLRLERRHLRLACPGDPRRPGEAPARHRRAAWAPSDQSFGTPQSQAR
ncbi:MAG: sugar phosphate nucleotidyltransferase [Isosphaeraceae bacterium]